MKCPAPTEVTELLLAWSQGDETALEKLIPLVYQQLRRLAHRYMRSERESHTFQTTDLVHEAYIRLIETPRVRWQDRSHFFAICAQLMRRILVDYARSRKYLKRGGGAQMIPLERALVFSPEKSQDLVALDDALRDLTATDPRKGQVVELRFFGGLTVDETAEALKISPATVAREWETAKVWLLRELSPGHAHDA